MKSFMAYLPTTDYCATDIILVTYRNSCFADLSAWETQLVQFSWFLCLRPCIIVFGWFEIFLVKRLNIHVYIFLFLNYAKFLFSVINNFSIKCTLIVSVIAPVAFLIISKQCTLIGLKLMLKCDLIIWTLISWFMKKLWIN